MSEAPRPAVGTIGWVDLTVPDAEGLRDFYQRVAGWTSQPVPMGDYDDYVMLSGETGVAGVCHRRGPNEALPPVWMIYIVVADLEASVGACRELGGEILVGPKGVGGDGARYAIIRDPEGAFCGLYQGG